MKMKRKVAVQLLLFQYKKICVLEAKKYITNCDNSVEGEWGFVNMIYNA